MNHIRVSNNARYTGATIDDWENSTHNFVADENTLLLIEDKNSPDASTFIDSSESQPYPGYDSSGNNNHWQDA